MFSSSIPAIDFYLHVLPVLHFFICQNRKSLVFAATRFIMSRICLSMHFSFPPNISSYHHMSAMSACRRSNPYIIKVGVLFKRSCMTVRHFMYCTLHCLEGMSCFPDHPTYYIRLWIQFHMPVSLSLIYYTNALTFVVQWSELVNDCYTKNILQGSPQLWDFYHGQTGRQG